MAPWIFAWIWWSPFLRNEPNTVSGSTVSNTELSEFLGLTEFRGASSVSSSQPIICVPKRTHRVFRRTHRVRPKTQWGSVSSLLRNSTLETVFRPFPNSPTTLIKTGRSAQVFAINGGSHRFSGLVAPSTG